MERGRRLDPYRKVHGLDQTGRQTVGASPLYGVWASGRSTFGESLPDSRGDDITLSVPDPVSGKVLPFR